MSAGEPIGVRFHHAPAGATCAAAAAVVAAGARAGAHRSRARRGATAPGSPRRRRRPLDPERHYLEGEPEDVARLPAGARRDQLRLRLVSDAAQAPRGPRAAPGERLLHRRLVRWPTTCARTGPHERPAARGEHPRDRRDPRPAPGPRADEPLRAGAARARSFPRRAARAGPRGGVRWFGRAPGGTPRGVRWRCSTTAASTSAPRSSRRDLPLAGVAEFGDLDRLTIFADNLVPHVLRCDGVLVYDERAGSPDRRRVRSCGPAEPSARSAPVPCTPAS